MSSDLVLIWRDSDVSEVRRFFSKFKTCAKIPLSLRGTKQSGWIQKFVIFEDGVVKKYPQIFSKISFEARHFAIAIVVEILSLRV